jgi:hypothetical protein
LIKNFGHSETPFEDSIQYGLTLLSAHHALENEKYNDADSIEGCIKLLHGTKDSSFEVNELFNYISQELTEDSFERKNFLKNQEQINEAKTVLSDFLNEP